MIKTVSEPTRYLADKVQAVVLDWAGTTVDFGSRAPIAAILAAFESRGVTIFEKEARRPMGRAKRDHLQELLSDKSISQRWATQLGKPPGVEDLDALYESFLMMQVEIVASSSEVIDGCVEAVEHCRARGIKVGATTGYTRALLEPVARRAQREGYTPDVALTADDVSPGRPAPWLCIETARRLGVYPMSAVVKVDDTPAGIAAGRNAGAWAVGVVASGNEVGLGKQDFADLAPDLRAELMAEAERRLADAGAHLLIDTIKDLPEAIASINNSLARRIAP